MKNSEWESIDTIPKDGTMFEVKIRGDEGGEVIKAAWWWGPPLVGGGDDIATTRGIYSLESVLGWRKMKNRI